MSEASEPTSADAAPALAAPLTQGLLLGTVAAAIAAVPGALRAASGGASAALCWVVLCGGGALVLGPVVAALRVAKPWRAGVASIPIGLLLALAPMIVLGRLLKAGTHHRPLGGATFAIVAVGLVLGGVAVAARLIAWSALPPGDRARRLARPALAALLAIALLAALALARAAFGGGSASIGGGVVDGVLALALGGAAATLRVPAGLARAARIAGPVLWLVVAVAGPVAGRAAPAAQSATVARAPVLVGPAAWLDR